MRRFVASMVVEQVAPGPLLRHHGSVASPWPSLWSSFLLHRHVCHALPLPASSGCRRQEQGYSRSYVAVRGSSGFKP